MNNNLITFPLKILLFLHSLCGANRFLIRYYLISLSVSPFAGSASINVSNSADSSQFAIPENVNQQQQLYVIKKSKDFIGIVTEVGLTTSTSGLYFISNASNRFDYKFEKNQTPNELVTGTCSKIRQHPSRSSNRQVHEI